MYLSLFIGFFKMFARKIKVFTYSEQGLVSMSYTQYT